MKYLRRLLAGAAITAVLAASQLPAKAHDLSPISSAMICLFIGSTPATVTFVSVKQDNTNASTYTETSIDIGSTSGYKLIGITGHRNSGTPATITSVTMNGTAMTLVAGASATNTANIIEWWIGNCTGSASCTVSVVFGQTQNQMTFSVYHVDNLQSTTPTQVFTSTAANPTGTLNISAGGFAVAMAMTEVSSSFTWAGLSERNDTVVTSEGHTQSSASANFSAAQSGLSITATPASSTRPIGVGVSFR